MKAGTVPEPLEARNKEIVADFLRFKASGKSFTARMVGKYKISMSRIYEILKANGVTLVNPRKKNK